MRFASLAAVAAAVLGGNLVEEARAAGLCTTAKCVVKREHRAEVKREWRDVRRHPMPACTWMYESGDASIPEYAPSRYRAVNSSSGAGGKYQFMPSTWAAVGGTRYAQRAELATPLEQERMARVLARHGISVHWVNCS